MIIKKLLQEKMSLFELILIAIIFGLGVELISNYFITSLDFNKIKGLLLGCFLMISGFSYFLYKIIKLKKTTAVFKGFILYNKKENKVIEAPRYKFSQELSEDLDCAFNENPALKKIWEADPLSNRFKANNDGKLIASIPKSYKLIYEATEYFILHQLSLHLISYFNNDKHKKNQLQEFNRKDIPSVLLENRFLELFSKPMEQRDAFVNDTLKDDKHIGRVVASYRKGFKFESFDLVLPIKSKIIKPNETEIIIETPRLQLKFSIDFQGMGTVLPYSFNKYYLGYEKITDLSELQIIITTTVKFKFKGYLTRKGWEYFEWVDSFINELNDKFSEEKFLKKINWNTMNSAIMMKS